MNASTLLSAGTLLFLALFMIAATSADLVPGRPLFPTADHRADFMLGLIGVVCAFAAGWVL